MLLLDARDRSKLVATTSTLILEANSYRVWAAFVNQGTTDIWLRLGAAAEEDKGIYLKASGGATLIEATNPWAGEVYGIAITAASKLTCQEVEERH